jgi:hypothetical protein
MREKFGVGEAFGRAHDGRQGSAKIVDNPRQLHPGIAFEDQHHRTVVTVGNPADPPVGRGSGTFGVRRVLRLHQGSHQVIKRCSSELL